MKSTTILITYQISLASFKKFISSFSLNIGEKSIKIIGVTLYFIAMFMIALSQFISNRGNVTTTMAPSDKVRLANVL
jgi:hypothetical protein